MTANSENKQKHLIWDLPVRLFHWLLVSLICFSWYSIEIAEDLDNHFISGYCVLALLVFRLIWGVIGTRYARFSRMIFKIPEILAYMRGFFSRQSGHYPGHNPLGSLSVIAMLLLLLVQTISGLFANDEDYYFGPLSDYVSTKTADRLTELHHLNFDVLSVVVALHIVAVFFYLFYKRENLITAMFSGKKMLLQGVEAITHSKPVIALLTLIFSASAVYLLVTFA